MPPTQHCGDRHEPQRRGLGRQARHDGGGFRALQGEQRPVAVRCQSDLAGQIGGEVGEVDVLSAGIDDHEQPVFVQPGDHEVIDDAAGVVGQQGVALAAWFKASDIAGDQGFQRRRHVGSVEGCLAHMRHIEQSCVGSRVQMFGQHAAPASGAEVAGEVKLNRHRIARERHHPSAVAAVPRVEWRGEEGRGVGSSGRAVWAK